MPPHERKVTTDRQTKSRKIPTLSGLKSVGIGLIAAIVFSLVPLQMDSV